MGTDMPEDSGSKVILTSPCFCLLFHLIKLIIWEMRVLNEEEKR